MNSQVTLLFVCLPGTVRAMKTSTTMLVVTLLRVFAVTFGMMNSMAYYFTDAVTEAFVNERTDAFNPDSSFMEIDGADDWYNVSTVKQYIP